MPPVRWAVEFYQREDGLRPAEAFFAGLGHSEAQELIGYIDRIAEDPLAFPAGAEWQAMRGEVRDCHEVRIRLGQLFYRVYVQVDSVPLAKYPGLGRMVLLSGEVTPVDTTTPMAVSRMVGEMAADYVRMRKVSPHE